MAIEDWEGMALVGRISRPHGLRGQVAINPETDFIEERFAAKGCIDDKIDLAAFDIVDDVRPSFVNFVDRFHVDAGTSEHACGSSRGDDFETNFQQVSGNFRNEIFVVLIHADERNSGLW